MNEKQQYVVHSVATNRTKIGPDTLDVGRTESWDVCQSREEAERVRRERQGLGYDANIE